MAVIFIIFIVFNLIIYHKIFNVIYFNLGKGLFKEFAVSFFLAGIETAILMAIGPYILVAFGVVLAICLIVKVINNRKDKGKSDDVQVTNSKEEAPDKKTEVVSEISKTNTVSNKDFSNQNKVAHMQSQSQSDTEIKKSQNTLNDTNMFCSHCGKQILRTAKFCNFCGKQNNYNK